MLNNEEIDKLIISDDKSINSLSIAFTNKLKNSTKQLITIIKENNITDITTLKNMLGVEFIKHYKFYYNEVLKLHNQLMINVGVTEKYKELNLSQVYLKQYDINLKQSKKFIKEIINVTFFDLSIDENLDIKDIEEVLLPKYLTGSTKSAINTKMYSEMTLMSTYRTQNEELGKELGIKKFRMYGALDSRTSDICKKHIGNLKTDKQWKQVKYNYMTIGFHFLCRHTWLPDF